VKGKSLASFDLLVDAKGKLPREAFRHFFEESIREGTDEVARLINGIAADLAENRVGVALNDIELGDGTVGVDEETNDDSIDADLGHGLLNFQIPA